MPNVLDARGLLCPLPALRARAALAALQPGDELLVLATDPEAAIDLAALAAEGGHGFVVHATADGAASYRFVVGGEP